MTYLFESEECKGWKSQKGRPSNNRGNMGEGKQWAKTAVLSLQSTWNQELSKAKNFISMIQVLLRQSSFTICLAYQFTIIVLLRLLMTINFHALIYIRDTVIHWFLLENMILYLYSLITMVGWNDSVVRENKVDGVAWPPPLKMKRQTRVGLSVPLCHLFEPVENIAWKYWVMGNEIK